MSEGDDTVDAMQEADDRALGAQFDAIEPSDERLGRMEAGALASFDATQRSLTAEWIELLRVRPVANAALTLTAAAALILVTPIGWMLLALLRR